MGKIKNIRILNLCLDINNVDVYCCSPQVMMKAHCHGGDGRG